MKEINTLTIITATANCSGAMEPETMCGERSRTTKNGAKPKSHTSRRNFII